MTYSGSQELILLLAEISAINRKLAEIQNAGRVPDPSSHQPDQAHNLRMIAELEEKLQLMRLDRQVERIPKYIQRNVQEWIRRKRLFQHSEQVSLKISPRRGRSLAIVCPVYPGGSRSYGGEFIEQRVVAYSRSGWDVDVFEVSKSYIDREQTSSERNIRVHRLPAEMLSDSLKKLAPNIVCGHQVEQPIWQVLKTIDTPRIIWVHGFECRDWKELACNYSPAEAKKLSPLLNKINASRRETMSQVFESKQIKKVFVSNYMKTVGEKFVGGAAVDSHVIHNVIDERLFRYSPKSRADMFKILWVRSFSQKNYANDISQRVILELSKRDDFHKYSVSVFGDGPLFDSCTEKLRKFSNVTISRKFVDRKKMAKLHRCHGIMLVPTRWDSQGLTAGEAMASGLVVATNNVAAIPEFVSSQEAIVGNAGSHKDLADGIISLTSDFDRFTQMSRNASKRAHNACGLANTIDRELELFSPH
ncbi:MAG: glycosyltransferase family 4 protein [Maricaulis sp.]|nr:glycosyltransferase family 4 protein [Maricaulis sp.]